jgi:hypothetical protein
MPRHAPACERPGPLVVRKHLCVRVHAPSHRRARALAARARDVRWQQPHAVAQRRGVLGIARSTPSRARALCVPVASAPHVSFHYPHADRSTHGPMSTPRVPSEYPASSREDGPCSNHRSSTVSEVPAAARARTAPQRTRLPYARESPPSTLRARCEKAFHPIGAAVPCGAVVRAYSLSALREAMCASTAQVPLPPPQVLWKVCAHCGTAGVPFVARARRGHACSHPSSTRVQYPLGRRPMRPPRAVLV